MFYLLRYEGGDSSANRYRAKVVRRKLRCPTLQPARRKLCFRVRVCSLPRVSRALLHFGISAFRHFGILPCGLSPRVPCGFIHPLLLIVTRDALALVGRVGFTFGSIPYNPMGLVSSLPLHQLWLPRLVSGFRNCPSARCPVQLSNQQNQQ